MKCNECPHLEKGNCILPECIFAHISPKELLNKGIRIGKGKWEYKGVKYKSIGIDNQTGYFICVKDST